MTKYVLPEVQTNYYINGEWAEGVLDRREVTNPATGEVLVKVAQGDKAEVERAVKAAADAFPVWSQTELRKRVRMLNKIADLIEEEQERLATIMTMEQGKPLREAMGEIAASIEATRWSAEEAKRTYGELIPAPNEHKYEVKKQPIGVVGAITPWNFPSNMIVRKILPAIAAGCTVVLKPAGNTPLSAIALFEIFDKAGLPAGVVNLILAAPKVVGEVFAMSKDVRKLTFTGSTEVGQLLYEQSGKTLKKISLELGGHAPFIVCEDAPIEDTVKALVKFKFRNNGQACTAPNRIFVHEAIKETFTNQLVEAVKQLKVGNGMDEEVDLGPLINESAREVVDSQVKDAVTKGATLLTGGEPMTDGIYANGPFYQPTVLTDVTKEMGIFYEETFGPVIPVFSFNTLDEVIADANDSDYGLASYVYTKDMRTAELLSNRLEYGMVGVNTTDISQAPTPFGGVKFSGLGRENGRQGIEEFMETKFVHTAYF